MTVLEQRQLTLDIVNVLERMAFVLGEDAEEPRSDLAAFHAHAMVEIKGGGQRLVVVVSGDKPFLTEVASSMLGLMPAELESDQPGRQALQELGNVIGGEVVRNLGGEDIEFDLGLPKELAGKQLGLVDKLGTPICDCCVETDDGYLRVAVFQFAG